MKKLNKILIFGFILSVVTLNAQFDDLYYNPSTDNAYFDQNNDGYYDDDAYDYYYEDQEDQYYADNDYWNDYDLYYTRRIRSFHRPFVRMGFYNSWYANSLFYDPFGFYGPYGGLGFNVSVGSPYWNIGFAHNPWGWNNWGWNGWGANRWGWNAGWNSGWNSWGWNGGWGGYNPYCPPGYFGGGFGGPGYVNNVTVVNTYNQRTNSKGGYYGSRRSGSTSSSVKGVRTSPRTEATTPRQLNPGSLSEANSVAGAPIRDNEIKQSTPRRTALDRQSLAVSGVNDRPGRVQDGGLTETLWPLLRSEDLLGDRLVHRAVSDDLTRVCPEREITVVSGRQEQSREDLMSRRLDRAEDPMRLHLETTITGILLEAISEVLPAVREVHPEDLIEAVRLPAEVRAVQDLRVAAAAAHHRDVVDNKKTRWA